MSKGRSSGQNSTNRNNQKANVHNPGSAAHKAATDNRSSQLNSNNAAYNSSRQGNKK